MDVPDPDRDPWYTQSHYYALFLGTSVALGVSGYYYRRQNAIATCKIKGADFTDKTIIITGANTGIGFAAAEQFAELGAKVVLACRDSAKGAQAAEKIRSRVHNAQVTAEVLDVGNLESIRQFSSKMDRCHILVNNAGALFESKEILKNGIEKTFMTNYVGPWYLTRLLLPTLAKTSAEDQCETKVLVVGSRSENWSQLKTTFPIEGEAAVSSIFSGPLSPFKSMQAYSNSKLGNMLMAFELSRKLEQARSVANSSSADFTSSAAWKDLIYYDPLKSGLRTNSGAGTETTAKSAKKVSIKTLLKPPPSTADPYDSSYSAPLTSSSHSSLVYPYITVNALTPGMVATDIAREVAAKTWYGWLMQPVMMMTWKQPVEGGSEIVYAASRHGVSGKYFGEHKEVTSSAHSQDLKLARALWQETEKVVHRLLTVEESRAEMLSQDQD